MTQRFVQYPLFDIVVRNVCGYVKLRTIVGNYWLLVFSLYWCLDLLNATIFRKRALNVCLTSRYDWLLSETNLTIILVSILNKTLKKYICFPNLMEARASVLPK